MRSHCHVVTVGVAIALATLGAGCNEAAPVPTPLEGAAPSVQRPQRDPNIPAIRKDSPQVLAPSGREGEQLPDDQLDAVIAEADRYVSEGRESVATVRLRDCANKVPASARCDGRLGVLLRNTGRHRAAATYYLLEAAKTDDPSATPADYDAVADALRKLGRYEASIAARKLAIAREDTAQRHAEMSAALQGIPGRNEEAMTQLARAYEMDPTGHQWLHDRATLMARDPARRREAAGLFKTYLERTRGEMPGRDARIEGRIAELETATP